MNSPLFLSTVFWGSFAVVFYTFLGYPIFIGLLARRKNRNAPAPKTFTPTVSVVLVAHNEAQRICTRIKNIFATDHPAEKLELIVYSDGSNDDTPALIQSVCDKRVHAILSNQRSGKAKGLNASVAVAKGEIIVFCDARQKFNRATIPNLVRNFADPKTGAVSGNYSIEKSDSSVGGGVDVYWRLEKFIRNAEAKWDSSIGCTGAIYAIRRELFRPLSGDVLLDDVVIPMTIAEQGYRIGFDEDAVSLDPMNIEASRENRRKKRTLAGNFQMLFRFPHWLLPWKNRLWWQLISHKYLRIFAPFFLAAVFVSNALLTTYPVYRALFVCQVAFYTLACIGLAFRSLNLRVISIPTGFFFLNLMTVGGFWNYLRGTYREGKW
ncbi:MAG: Family 2 glycosyl transferase [Verrucomicrobiales bacterium]|nr:Family 2 glycosyl transferase [Verrucomicrobiales bacterium]